LIVGRFASIALRVAAACALISFAVFAAAPKPASACKLLRAQIDACTILYNYVCSRNADGTGGYYVVDSGLITYC